MNASTHLRHLLIMVLLGAISRPTISQALQASPASQKRVLFRIVPTATDSLAVTTMDNLRLLGVAPTAARRIAPVFPMIRGLVAMDSLYEISVQLAADSETVVRLRRRPTDAGNQFTWSGVVVGQARSDVLLTLVGRTLVGTIQTNSGHYRIVPVGDEHYLVTDNREHLPNEGQPRRPPRPPRAAGDAPPSPTTGDPACSAAVVDVLVVLTPQSSAGLSDEALSALAQHGVDQANEAFGRSGVSHRLRLAGIHRTPYRESGNMDKDLTTLGTLPDVAQRRIALAADLVSLWVPYSKMYSICGLGYITLDAKSGSKYGFSVVRGDCALTSYSFAHEVGHNLGLDHDRQNTNGGGLDPYSFGYQDPSASFRTMMAYDCPGGCQRMLLYSTPSVVIAGKPAGVDPSLDPARSAANAFTLNHSMCDVANWLP